MIQEWQQGDYVISTDKERLDLVLIHDFLITSYWAAGIPFDVVKRAIAHSLPFGVYKGEQQIGLARVITDYSTFAYVADVFILEEYRGRGLSKWLMEVVAGHPDLQGLRRWVLFTRDAHGLYEKTGFTSPKMPERCMEKFDPDIYAKK